MPKNAPKPPVIGDVARRAGVSVPTVSRVLNGAAYVSDEKRSRVMQAIKELDFRPSAAARALVARQPKLIAVIAGNTSRYGYAETIRGIEESARAAGYTVTITVVESADDESVDRAVALVLDQPIAGVVVLKFDPPGVAALHRLPKSIPTVSISGVRETGVPQAVLAEADAAEEVVDYLLGLGHRTVHHVRVPPSRKEDGRTTGWRRALVAHGAPVPKPLDASWEPDTGRVIGRALADDPEVTAVFCGNDEIAMGVIRGLADRGKSVPRDVSVVGFDDHPLAQMWSPPLTTVRQDFAGLGTRAYDLLEAVIAGGKVRKFSSERPTVVIRESTAPPFGL
ncbi:MAG: LacI family DNA-binding transcriptional regulator [Leifsonia sp.]